MSNSLFQLTRHDGANFPVTERGLSIGRSRQNDLVIHDPEVSRVHARIWVLEGRYWIRDENSASGVQVNQRRISGQQELRVGDVIHIGGTALRVDPVNQTRSSIVRPANKQLPIILFGGGLLVAVVILISVSGSPAPVVRGSSNDQPVPVLSIVPTQPQYSASTLSPPSGAVSSRQNARDAVIQIHSSGDFADFESGEIVTDGFGSGFIIDSSGLAVTNNHVIAGARSITIWIGGDPNRSYSAELVGYAECSDLAVIDIEGTGFSTLAWYQGQVILEMPVYAAGFPLGEPQYTITGGAISRDHSSGDTPHSSLPYALMHTADITTGNSGGPLLSENGQVIGVNYAGRVLDNQYFAISSEVAAPIVQQLMKGHNVDSIGINGEAFLYDDEGDTISGVLVVAVQPGSKAQQVGLKAGDIIITFDDSYVGTDGTMADYCQIIRSHNLTSDIIPLGVYRLEDDTLLWGEINGERLSVVQD